MSARAKAIAPLALVIGILSFLWTELSLNFTFQDLVLLRTALVLARRGGALPQMARPFWFFAGGPLGSGRQHVSWIHLDDWVAMVRWAIGTAAISGPLNVTSPQPVTNNEMARTLGRVLHRPWFVPAPALALRLMLGTEMADTLLLNGRRAVPAKALANGFSFRYPDLESALRVIYEGAAPEARRRSVG